MGNFKIGHLVKAKLFDTKGAYHKVFTVLKLNQKQP